MKVREKSTKTWKMSKEKRGRGREGRGRNRERVGFKRDLSHSLTAVMPLLAPMLDSPIKRHHRLYNRLFPFIPSFFPHILIFPFSLTQGANSCLVCFGELLDPHGGRAERLPPTHPQLPHDGTPSLRFSVFFLVLSPLSPLSPSLLSPFLPLIFPSLPLPLPLITLPNRSWSVGT